MNNRTKTTASTAKTLKEIANEYGVHVNTVYKWAHNISLLLNFSKNTKKLTPKQVHIFYEYYGNPH